MPLAQSVSHSETSPCHGRSQLAYTGIFISSIYLYSRQLKDDDIDIFHQLELMKLYFSTNQLDKFKQSFTLIAKQISAITDEFKKQVIEAYFEQWRKQISINIEQSQALYGLTKQETSNGMLNIGIDKLLQTLSMHRGNLEIPHLIIMCLTKVWPKGWSKYQVKVLASGCIEQLQGSPVCQRPKYNKACHLISHQIGCELAAPPQINRFVRERYLSNLLPFYILKTV